MAARFTVMHVPKTGGSSLLEMLKAVYGPRLLHNGDGNTPVENYEAFDVLFGHFRFNKYQHLPRVLWVRDPIERLISHWTYWHIKPRPPRPRFTRHDKIRAKVWNGHLDISGLALALPNHMAHYLNQNPRNLDACEFVGIFEQWEPSLERFERHFGLTLDRVHVQRTIGTKPEVSERERRILRRYLARDYKVYERALARVG